MDRSRFLPGGILLLALLIFGCSGGGPNPLLPEDTPILTENTSARAGQSNTHLWGWYEVTYDRETRSVEVIPNREMMFTANVVNFLNGNPAGLTFKIKGTPVGPGYIDVDIDVSITHPFPGMPQYHGYDVRGIFMGDGSGMLAKGGLTYPVNGEDQYMFANPDNGHGEPDGYTRWFNYPEFTMGGMPLFQYTPGNIASPGFSGSSEINPYKYFADGLDEWSEPVEWLKDHADQDGVFSSGATNTRNYYLRFPNDKGVTYGYAIIANWGGPEPENHPSNAPEAVVCNSYSGDSTLFWISGESGGEMVLDLEIWNWDGVLNNGVMEEYNIYIESNILNDVYELSSDEMTPVGGGDHYSTYHVEIPADNVQGTDNNEYWVIVEEEGYDYTNEFGAMNGAWEEPLTAYFRHDIAVGGDIPAWIEVTSPNGGEEFVPGEETEITWVYGGLTGTVELEYSKDEFVADVHAIDVGVAVSDESYTWTVPCDPSDTLRVRVTSEDMPSVSDMSDGDFSVFNSGWGEKWGDAYYDEGRRVDFDSGGNVYLAGTHRPSPGDRNYGFVAKSNPCGELLWDQAWGGTGHTQGYDVAVDSYGNAYVTGNFYGTTDFDPDDPGGPNRITSVATWDVWLVKFDTSGDFVWVRTWGGGYSDSGRGVAVDDSGDVYVTGIYSLTVNFDPTGGTDNHTSAGDFDCFLTKINGDGTYGWTKTWGGPGEDRPRDVAYGGGNAYVTGYFSGSDVNFNPDGLELISSNGGWDLFLSAWSGSGTFQFAYGWGGTSDDEGLGVAADSGYAYAVGRFRGYNVNFDPTGGTDNHNANGADDSYLSKFDSSGNFVWARTWGGTSNDQAHGVGVDGSGNVFTTGDFWTMIDLDPDGGDTHPVVGFIDAYISKIDASGNYQWGRIWGSTQVDRGFGVNCDGSGNTYVTGFISGQADLAPGDSPCNEPEYNVTPTGSSDAFLIKYLAGDGCWQEG